jgi:hypothetical protein
VEWIDLAGDSACEHGNDLTGSRNTRLSGVYEDLLSFQE